MTSYPTASANVELRDSEGPLDGILLGSFIKNFAVLHNAIVSAASEDKLIHSTLMDFDKENIPTSGSLILGRPLQRQLIAHRYFAEHGSWLQHQKNVSGDNWLRVTSIQKNSPFEMVIDGIAIAIVAAAIFSGGTIKVVAIGLEVKLPPFGHGLQAIRDAVKGGNRPRLQAEQRQVGPRAD